MGSGYSSILGALTLWSLAAWLATAFFAGHVADTKDRCRVCWFVWGLLFGPLALLAAAGMAPVRARQA